ncbi:MAG TPA: endolytic transglycosylase MltG [Candidatus Campbellbacteria bacterium]|nr:endolytic transglycosylase MltG [Candidatus Campbellbacteria bacterium]
MRFSKRTLFIFAAITILISLIAAGRLLAAPPSGFPVGRLIGVENGLSLWRVGAQLEKESVVRSRVFFVFLAKLEGKENNIKSGDYFFERPISVFGVVKRLGTAGFGLDPIKVMLREGLTLKDIAGVFSNFKNFDKKKFLSDTKGMEGYLFPDTYFFSPNVDEMGVVKIMTRNFKKKAGKIDYDTLIMASLIEKEAADYKDRRIVSGILWKRLKEGMPLQVDAVFPYIIGKSSRLLTLDDLKIDSPYNTYLYKGLPPAPICNPGSDAIDAARNPEKSPYWFYLSDKKGVTHFSKTFAEHRRNKAKYLRQKKGLD